MNIITNKKETYRGKKYFCLNKISFDETVRRKRETKILVKTTIVKSAY